VTVEEQLLEILHALPPALQAEVLDFAEFLWLRLKPAPQLPAAGLMPLPTLEGRVPPGWKNAIYDHR